MKGVDQTMAVYISKVKHNGVLWTVRALAKRLLAAMVGYQDSTLLIYKVPLDQMPMLDPKLEGVEYRFVPPDQKDKILALKDPQINQEKVDHFFSNGSKCMGAFLGDQLIGYGWVHFREYSFPGFEYTINLKENEAYDGPDFIVPEFRGQRIQPAMLTRVADYLRREGIPIGYGSMLKDNLASIRGSSKTGATPTEEIRVVKFAGRRIKREQRLLV